jgi:SAM-dependent methyltransferase
MPSDDDAAALDAMLEPTEHRKWQRFYADRQRACPFFVDVPDENLVRWVESERVPRGAAIDLGCGQGRNAVFLARQGWQVQAVDISASAVAWARERVAACGVPVTVMQCSVFELPASTGPFDFAYDGGCFHHLAPHRRQRYVDVVAGRVRRGGCFGLVCFRPEGGSGYSDAEVYDKRSLGGGLGYTEEQLRAIWSGPFEIESLVAMEERAAEATTFGRRVLWTMLARRR